LIAVFRKSSTPDPGIFQEKPYNPASLRRETVMIICGPGVLGRMRCRSFLKIAGTSIALLKNPDQRDWEFSKIRSNGIKDFGKSSRAQSRI